MYFFQFEIQASDQGEPEQISKSRIVVVFKTDKPPRFDNLPREQKVSENAQNGSKIYDIRGNDDDRKGKLMYALLPATPATDIFYVLPESGELKIKDAALLKRDGGTKYTVSGIFTNNVVMNSMKLVLPSHFIS